MDDADWDKRDEFSIYPLGNCWSLRRAGLKGLRVEARIVGDAAPLLILTGSRRGRAEIPLADIRCIRAAVDQGKTRARDFHRCMIWRDGERKLVLRPMSGGTLIYGRLVVHLAEEMKRIGRFDRVERGLQGWESALYALLMVVLAGFLSYVGYDTLQGLLRPIETKDRIFAGILWGFSALLLIGSVVMSSKANRPRAVRSLNDLRQVLP